MQGPKIAAVALMSVVSVGTLWAADSPQTPQASGKFSTGGAWFEVMGAYAFAGPVGVDDRPGTLVAISNGVFKPAFFDLAWNRPAAIVKYFQDDQTPVVYFHFDKDGDFLGTSWLWGSGQSCAFCSSSSATSTVKLADGRARGRVAVKDTGDGTSYDVTFDVPIAPLTPGKQVAVDGEAAKAYLAFHRAVQGGDANAVEGLVTQEERDQFASAKSKGEDFVSALAEGDPEQVTIKKAYESGDNATLIIEGHGLAGRLNGEVYLKREGGVWRFDDGFVNVGDWPAGYAP